MTKDNQEELKRQWMEALGPGWPCEVWDDTDNIFVMFFSGYRDGEIIFTENKKNVGKIIEELPIGFKYKNYRPLSTPLDFAPDWATHIKTDKNGNFKFLRLDPQKIQHMYSDKETEWYLWPNCPERLKGRILAIPDDWRPKCS